MSQEQLLNGIADLMAQRVGGLVEITRSAEYRHFVTRVDIPDMVRPLQHHAFHVDVADVQENGPRAMGPGSEAFSALLRLVDGERWHRQWSYVDP